MEPITIVENEYKVTRSSQRQYTMEELEALFPPDDESCVTSQLLVKVMELEEKLKRSEQEFLDYLYAECDSYGVQIRDETNAENPKLAMAAGIALARIDERKADNVDLFKQELIQSAYIISTMWDEFIMGHEYIPENLKKQSAEIGNSLMEFYNQVANS